MSQIVNCKERGARGELQSQIQDPKSKISKRSGDPRRSRDFQRGERSEGQNPHSPTFTRVPVRVKIAFPFAVLALLFALASAYLVSQIVFETIEERFANQLIESGKVSADWIAREENRLLKTWRLVAFTQGVPEALGVADAEHLRELVLPIAVNYHEETVEALDLQGTSVLSLRHRSGGGLEDYDAVRGEADFAQWEFVQNALQLRAVEGRDKFAGLARAAWGDYVYVAGPLYDADDKATGVLLVGKSLSTIVRQIREDTLSHTTVYGADGIPIASTIALAELQPVELGKAAELLNSPASSLMRDQSTASVNYGEIVSALETREASRLGLLGSALPQTFFVSTSQTTRLEIFALVALAILVVIGVGIYLADRITHPLLRVVNASEQVAEGKLDVEVKPVGNDEIADLANSFNSMVAGLREGSIYRDLLGRTVSPEVRERMREALASGRLRLEGQEAVATVLMADIRGFTTLSEKNPPTTVLNWLNEYFGELVPIIAKHGGVVNKFDGDAVLAFFGILPVQLSAEASAHHACRAALEMLETIDRINQRRSARGEPPFITGIGVNTGLVTAGGLGTADRLSYTIIGDTVNTTQRIEDMTRQFGENGAVISENTWQALGERRQDFNLEPLGAQALRGKQDALPIFRLRPSELNEPASQQI